MKAQQVQSAPIAQNDVKISSITIGADPECFIFNGDTPYPIVGMLDGSKDHPLIVKEGSAMVEDNVMAEYNIPPCSTAEQFIAENRFMLDEILKTVKHYGDFKLVFTPAVNFDPVFLQTAQASEFGCEPDYSAYTNTKKQPSAGEAGTLRTAGGHIHIGWEGDKSEATQKAVVRAFDMVVVLPFMLIEPENDRRRLYGAPGSMRPKKYGVECRQLSCYWLNSDELMAWVFNKTLEAVEFFNNNTEIRNPESALCKEVYSLIMNKDLNAIKAFCKKHALVGA
jgi:hypothetical protein